VKLYESRSGSLSFAQGSWQVVAEACVFRDIDLQFTTGTPIPEAQPLGSPRTSSADEIRAGAFGSSDVENGSDARIFFSRCPSSSFSPIKDLLAPNSEFLRRDHMRKEKLQNAVSAVSALSLSRVRNRRRSEHYFSLTMSN
jgi:hypothetical protein